MAINRIIYTHSLVSLTTSNVNAGSALNVKTAQNATFTISVPRENVNAFGISGVVDRPQLNVEEATLEFAFIPQSNYLTGVQSFSDLDGAAMGQFMANSLNNAPSSVYSDITAAGVGALTKSLMNSASVDAAIGAMPTTTVGFTGKGGTIPTAGTPSANTTVTGMVLVEPKHIILGSALLPNQSCAQSAAVAWDLPVELILCLGQDPTLAASGEAFGNPPGTASITVESLQDEINQSAATANYSVTIGDFVYTLGNARVDSKTNSLAVGDLFGTFNYVLGGTADGMTCVEVSP